MKKLYVAFLLFFGESILTSAQVTFQRSYGGTFDDNGTASQQTSDGGYIFVGNTQSYLIGNRNIYLIKTDAYGTVQWNKVYGNGVDEWGYSVQQTTDGGYVVAGTINGGGPGGRDAYLLKTDASGNVQWNKSYGGTRNDEAYSVQQTTDGGYILGGYSRSFSCCGDDNVYIIKTASTGALQWSRVIDNNTGSNDFGRSIRQTLDGGYICVGYTDGGIGNWDIYLVKLTNTGSFSWAQDYGAGGNDYGYAVKQLRSGDYIITGSADDYGPGNGDVILMKTDINGNQLWSEALGGPQFDAGYSVQQLGNGDFIIGGETGFGAGGQDFYAIKTDSSGNLLNSKTYGGTSDDIAYSIEQTTDGGFIVSGQTQSFSQAGDWNFYLVKTDASLNTLCNSTSPATAVIPWVPATTGTPNNSSPATSVTNFVPTVIAPVPGLTCVCMPKADFSSNAPGCTGSPVNFYNTGDTGNGITYLWKFDTGATPATSTQKNPTGIIYSKSGIKNVKLYVTNGACTDSVFKTINIHQTPTVTFTSTAPQCAGTGVTFTNTGSSGPSWSYAWSFGQNATPATSNSENQANVIYSTGGNKQITFTISDAYCSFTDTSSILINSTPVANFSSNAPGCTGSPVNFYNTSDTGAGITYLWKFDTGATPATSTQKNPTGIIYSKSGIKNVKLYVTNGTCTDSVFQQITIHQTPTVTFTSNAPQCAGVGVTFTNTGSSGNSWSYAWSFGQNATPATSVSENQANVIYSTGGNKQITFTISDAYCSLTDTSSININPLPVAEAGKDTTICPNTSVQIGSASVAGLTYKWFPVYTLNNAYIANPVASPTAPVSEYVVTATNSATGCTSQDSVQITMLSPLTASAGDNATICRYDSVQIGAGLIKGEMYSWTPATGLSSTNSPNPKASPPVTTTYTLSVTDTLGCASINDEVTITVHQLPLAEAGKQDTITVGSSVQLLATGGVQYLWSPPTGLNNNAIQNPLASPDTTTTYIVTVTDVYGCINTDTMKVVVYNISNPFWIPTSFTPNGDGHNDILYVRGQVFTTFQFGVYDRNGQLMFFTENINQGWDGRNKSGELMPPGAYAYLIKGITSDGKSVDATGLVNLVR